MKEFDIDEFREYLRIDKNLLDRELVQGASLLFKVSEQFSLAAAERDALKENLASVDAQLNNECRASLNKQHDKVTEAMIANSVQMHLKHGKAFTEFLEAKKQADILFGLKEAFQSRGYFIRDLCSLYQANYFDTNSVKATAEQDKTTYQMTRNRLARAREERKAKPTKGD